MSRSVATVGFSAESTRASSLAGGTIRVLETKPIVSAVDFEVARDSPAVVVGGFIGMPHVMTCHKM
jgi:hypothetical protein